MKLEVDLKKKTPLSNFMDICSITGEFFPVDMAKLRIAFSILLTHLIMINNITHVTSLLQNNWGRLMSNQHEKFQFSTWHFWTSLKFKLTDAKHLHKVPKCFTPVLVTIKFYLTFFNHINVATCCHLMLSHYLFISCSLQLPPVQYSCL